MIRVGRKMFGSSGGFGVMLVLSILELADIIHSQREIEVVFLTLKNSRFPLAQGIKYTK